MGCQVFEGTHSSVSDRMLNVMQVNLCFSQLCS